MLDFQRNIDQFKAAGIKVIAASVDTLDNAKSTVKKYGLEFKVGYGLNARETSAQLGGFYNEQDGYLHASGFVLSPEGMIVNAVYSTAAVGRLLAKDCLGLIKYLNEKK